MIDRGLEPFVDAVRACQSKGAVAVVVRNVESSGDDESDLVVMGAAQQNPGISVSSVFVSRKTGDELDAMLAIEQTIFVELFAADDVNSLMAYIAYLVMSVESLFFALLIMLVVAVFATRRMHRGRRTCRRPCCRPKDGNFGRTALIVNDRSLLEPLQPNVSRLTSAETSDLESKIRTDRVNLVTLSYPVVFVNGTQQQHSVSIPVNNDEPIFEQQEQ